MSQTLQTVLPKDQWVSGEVSPEVPIHRIVIDSREAKSGDLFFALRGTQIDSHKFVDAVLAQGAIAVVESGEQKPGTIHVGSTRKVLGETAARWFGNPSEHFSLVGVTGTNGKTTTAFLLRQIWEGIGKESGLLGTVETWFGPKRQEATLTTPAPLDLQEIFSKMVEAKVHYGVMEVSSIALDQERTAGTRFSGAVFSNLTQDHLDYHHTMEEYFQAKQRLFDEDLEFAVVNFDDPYGRKIQTKANRIDFSLENPKADLFFSEITTNLDGSRAKLHAQGTVFDFSTQLMGRHNLSNCLAALGACDGLGLPLERVLPVIARAPGAPGRLERVASSEERPSVFVDYAHTPDALRNVVSILSELKGEGRLFTVFGCGGDRDRTKRPQMAEIASQGSDVTIATSDNPRTEDPSKILDDVEPGIAKELTTYHREVDRRSAIYFALSQATAKDVVLIAGKGHEDYQILGTEKIDFDDREVVRDYYSSHV